MTRVEGVALLHEFVQHENLRRHMYAVEAAMRVYAQKFDGDPEEWGLAGLLHDFDWEIHPTLEDHPQAGQSILHERGVPETIRHAILTHAPHTGVPPITMMEKCLFAVDEISGFIVACALVQPDRRLSSVTVERIQKKLKNVGFAAKVNRAEIEQGVQLLGLTAEEHFGTVLKAMQDIHELLGL